MVHHFSSFQFIADTQNSTQALQMALNQCADGDTLCLGGGTWHFYAEGASTAEYCISNNDYGEKKIIFHLKDRQNLTIDGEGAELIFHGLVMPFVLDGCKNMILRNFCIDYATPIYAQAEIVAAGADYTDLYFDQEQFCCHVAEGQLWLDSKMEGWSLPAHRSLVTEFDEQGPVSYDRNRPYIFVGPKMPKSAKHSLYYWLEPEQIDEHIIRLHGATPMPHTVGNTWVATFGQRFNPGIFIDHSSDVQLQQINLYHTAAMGVIAQMSSDLTLDRVRCEVRPESGRKLSLNADATHFVNCAGKITLNDCKFTDMLDDAGNFHGIYMILREKRDAHTLIAGYGHPQQVGVNPYCPGDRIRLINPNIMQPVAEYTVETAVQTDRESVQVTVKEQLPVGAEGLVVENPTRMPQVFIYGCECGNNRPRGFLLTSCKKTVVENCLFYNMTAAIEMAGDANSWYESGPVNDVSIRGNRFENAGYSGGHIIQIIPRIPEKTEQCYHRNILIEDNHFRIHEPRFLEAHFAENLIFRKNTYIQDETLNAHPVTDTDGILLQDCSNCTIELPVPCE